MTLALALLFSVIGSAGSALLAATVLAVNPSTVERALPRLISFSAGTLLGAAFLGMLPHAADTIPGERLFQAVLAGIAAFLVMERLLLWRHCHKEGCDVHAASGPMLLFGDAVHNFVDGVVIAGAFLVSIPLGIATALSTVAHEVPQELGEFMVYLRIGYSRRRALLLNTATSLTTLLGTAVGWAFLSEMRAVGPYLLAFAAAGFVYVALADLVPAQRGRTGLRVTVIDLLLLGAGIAIIGAVAHGGH